MSPAWDEEALGEGTLAEARQAQGGLWTPRILFQDARLVAIEKPAGVMVHHNPQTPRLPIYALQATRDLLARSGVPAARLWPVHRLDRPTSGVLLFALDAEMAAAMGTLFELRQVTKDYRAIVRGWPRQDRFEVERPLKIEGAERAAYTRFEVLARTELPIAVGRFPTARYCLLGCQPQTGRFHQIRRHLNGAAHPIVGDTSHGDRAHNRLFIKHLDSRRLLLHAASLCFERPFGGGQLRVSAGPFVPRLMARLGFDRMENAGSGSGEAGRSQDEP